MHAGVQRKYLSFGRLASAADGINGKLCAAIESGGPRCGPSYRMEELRGEWTPWISECDATLRETPLSLSSPALWRQRV